MDKVKWTEPEAGIAALGQIPVEGATAEIILAYLPSCAAYGVTLNFWVDFRSTSSETISVRPHIYLIGVDADHAFSPKELEPGQSYSDIHPRGWPWVGGVYGMWSDFLRVEAAIEVYTPEGWVEVDRAAGEPFEWQYTYPLPELTITKAPEYAPAFSMVDIECAYYNPGFCSPPSGGIIANGERFPGGGGYIFPPDQTTPFPFTFPLRGEDLTIEITPFRNETRAGEGDILGKPVSVTIRVATVPMYHLDISINGEGIVLPEDVSGDYLEGEVIELTAYGSPGWWFQSWEGTDNNSTNPTTVTMDGDRNVVANFTQEARAGCLPVVTAGILLVAGLIACVIAFV